MRALERFLLLQIIDQRWREHLYDMDYLREGIHLRGFAQIDPLVAYKNEGFALFQDLMNSIWSDFARMVYNVQVEVEGRERRQRPLLQQQRSGAAARRRSTTRAAPPRTSRAPTAEPDEEPQPAAAPWWSSAASTSTSSSAATTRAGAGRARSTRSATARSGGPDPGRGGRLLARPRPRLRRGARASTPAARSSPCGTTTRRAARRARPRFGVPVHGRPRRRCWRATTSTPSPSRPRRPRTAT